MTGAATVTVMRTSHLDEIGARDGWRCWICDETVDPDMSVNDARGPSVDSLTARARQPRGRRSFDPVDRLAHRGCNSKKGAVPVVIPWPADLLVSDPAPLAAVADRLRRKGGREVVARCPSAPDADAVAHWLVDRFTRLTPDLSVTADVRSGGGQFLVALLAG
jgi:hypothetical protein